VLKGRDERETDLFASDSDLPCLPVDIIVQVMMMMLMMMLCFLSAFHQRLLSSFCHVQLCLITQNKNKLSIKLPSEHLLHYVWQMGVFGLWYQSVDGTTFFGQLCDVTVRFV